jgi:hypothetical protein
MNPVIATLPKSGTVYVQKCCEGTLGAVHHRVVCPAGNVRDDIIAEALFRLSEHPRAVIAEHIPANAWNLSLLRSSGIDRITLLVRDPRDALVSWWRHLERSDIRLPWIIAHLSSSGPMSTHYYDLSPEGRLADLITCMFPAMQEWLAAWGATIDRAPYGSADIHVHLLR